MGGKKCLDDCKTRSEIDHYVRTDPRVREIRQNGSHVIVKGPLPGSAVYPTGTGDMPNGTRRSVVKMLIAIGLGIFMMICFLSNMTANASFENSSSSSGIVETIDGILCDWTGDSSVCK